MKTLNVSDVRKNLPQLMKEISTTKESIIVMRNGTPLVMMVPYKNPDAANPQDALPLRGLPFHMSPDFDAPLEDEWKAFEP
jgi:antitoxin (DNA-binding transcriptional repressor) of toxin-antitoxin stability system